MLTRFSGVALEYTGAGFSSKGGVALAVGTTLGSNRAHEANFELIHVPWSFRLREASLSPNGFLGRSGSGDLTPLLANYRYTINGPTARVGFYVGAGVGATRISGDLQRLLSGTTYSAQVKEWSATGAVTVGISGTITNSLRFDLGYRYLHIDGANVPSRLMSSPQTGPDLSFEAPHAHVASLGFTLSF